MVVMPDITHDTKSYNRHTRCSYVAWCAKYIKLQFWKDTVAEVWAKVGAMHDGLSVRDLEWRKFGARYSHWRFGYCWDPFKVTISHRFVSRGKDSAFFKDVRSKPLEVFGKYLFKSIVGYYCDQESSWSEQSLFEVAGSRYIREDGLYLDYTGCTCSCANVSRACKVLSRE